MNSLHRLFTAKDAGLISRSSYLQMVGCPQLKSRIYDRNLISCRCNIVHSRILAPNTYTKTYSCQATGAYSDKNEQLFQIVNFDEKYIDSDNLNSDSDNLNSDSDNLNSDSNQNER